MDTAELRRCWKAGQHSFPGVDLRRANLARMDLRGADLPRARLTRAVLDGVAAAARSLALVRQSYFCIEGSPRAARAARLLVRRLGARHFEIKTEMKELYHAAAVMASGGVVSLLSICLEALTLCGLDEHRSRKVLMPLVEATVANVRAIGPARALTGPVRRGDAKTIERNKRALAKIDSRWLQIYMLLTENSLASQKQSGESGASRS